MSPPPRPRLGGFLVCPKHWQLPSGGWDKDENPQIDKSSFYQLLVQYGWDTSTTSTDGTGPINWQTNPENVSYSFLLHPFYELYTGYLDIRLYILQHPGESSFAITKSADPNQQGMFTTAFAMNDYIRLINRGGYLTLAPLRCLTQ